MNKLNADLIYYISNFLSTKEQKRFLSTDKESCQCFNFDLYKTKIFATKIQRWWRKYNAPLFVEGTYGYHITFEKLIENWPRYKDRQIQFVQNIIKYDYVNGSLHNISNKHDSLGIIYTLTCLSNIIYENDTPFIVVGYPGFYNMTVRSRPQSFPIHLTRSLQTMSMPINKNFIYKQSIYVVTRCIL